jgi:hypothetical protein
METRDPEAMVADTEETQVDMEVTQEDMEVDPEVVMVTRDKEVMEEEETSHTEEEETADMELPTEAMIPGPRADKEEEPDKTTRRLSSWVDSPTTFKLNRTLQPSSKTRVSPQGTSDSSWTRAVVSARELGLSSSTGFRMRRMRARTLMVKLSTAGG